MHFQYKTKGTCTKLIDFDIEEGVMRNVRFTGGCDGNLKAVSKLVEGRDAREVAECLEGNLCRQKGTSCGDQLSKAILQALEAAKGV